MGKYIEFSEEQKQMANQVDLVEFLRNQGEQLELSGKEFRWMKNTSVTIKGNRWFQHKYQEGGYPVSFLKRFYGYTYPEAVQCLLNESGVLYDQSDEQEIQKEFHPPEVNETQKRIYGYLLKQRFIDNKVLNIFTEKQLIYESKPYHNVVFAGYDEEGIMKHAHKKSTFSNGKSYRGNETGSDPRYSFHWNGSFNKIYVFEAPIDMLSYISLHQEKWEQNHYVALNGVSARPLLYQLETHSNINEIVLCLDHDIAGSEAMSRIKDELMEHGYFMNVSIEQSKYKDWNEDLKEKNQVADLTCCVENPKLIMFEHHIQKYKEQLTLPKAEIEMKDIMDEYMKFFSVLNDQTKNHKEVKKRLCELSTKAVKFYQQLLETEVDIIKLMSDAYQSHKDRGNLTKRIETLKDSIHKLKDCYVHKEMEHRQQMLMKRLLDVADDSMLLVVYLDIQDDLEEYLQEENKMEQNMKPKCPLIGSDGNVFNLIGVTARSLKMIGEDELAKEMQTRVMNSESYEEALSIMDEYVDVTSTGDFSEEIFRELDHLKIDMKRAGLEEQVKEVSTEVMSSEDGEMALIKIESYRNTLFPNMNLGMQ